MPSSFSSSSAASPTPPAVAAVLLPLVPIVFIAFLVVGLAMPVLPLHVHDGLGMDTFVVGLVAGAQFAASLISRFWSGRHADSKGGKRALVVGLLLAAAAGLFYELCLRFTDMPRLSVAILLLGRALLGGAESFVVTGATGWGLALAGPQNAGLAPLASLLLALPLRHVAPQAHARSALRDVLGAVWVPGIGCALASLGYGAIITFIALLFSQRGWPSAWLALTGFSVALIVARLCFSGSAARAARCSACSSKPPGCY